MRHFNEKRRIQVFVVFLRLWIYTVKISVIIEGILLCFEEFVRNFLRQLFSLPVV